jgi:hypothetical protein
MLCDRTDYKMCNFGKSPEFEGAMRVDIRRRFLVLFCYTLEIGFGGCNSGSKNGEHMTPVDYRLIGESSVKAIYELFFETQSYVQLMKDTMRKK